MTELNHLLPWYEMDLATNLSNWKIHAKNTNPVQLPLPIAIFLDEPQRSRRVIQDWWNENDCPSEALWGYFFYRKLKIKVIFFSLPAIIEVSALFELNEDPSWCPIWPRERCPRPSNHWTEPPKITQVNYVDEAYLAAEEFLWCNWHTHAMGPNVQVDRQD